MVDQIAVVKKKQSTLNLMGNYTSNTLELGEEIWPTKPVV